MGCTSSAEAPDEPVASSTCSSAGKASADKKAVTDAGKKTGAHAGAHMNGGDHGGGHGGGSSAETTSERLERARAEGRARAMAEEQRMDEEERRAEEEYQEELEERSRSSMNWQERVEEPVTRSRDDSDLPAPFRASSSSSRGGSRRGSGARYDGTRTLGRRSSPRSGASSLNGSRRLSLPIPRPGSSNSNKKGGGGGGGGEDMPVSGVPPSRAIRRKRTTALVTSVRNATHFVVRISVDNHVVKVRGVHGPPEGGGKSRSALGRMINGKTVALDVWEVTEGGVWVADVRLEGRLIALELVRQGFLRLSRHESRRDLVRQQEAARKEGVGMWAADFRPRGQPKERGTSHRRAQSAPRRRGQHGQRYNKFGGRN